jgi:ADP-heptose:LPS heptosyltransferase/GT2 family glycosyltransferase
MDENAISPVKIHTITLNLAGTVFQGILDLNQNNATMVQAPDLELESDNCIILDSQKKPIAVELRNDDDVIVARISHKNNIKKYGKYQFKCDLSFPDEIINSLRSRINDLKIFILFDNKSISCALYEEYEEQASTNSRELSYHLDQISLKKGLSGKTLHLFGWAFFPEDDELVQVKVYSNNLLLGSAIPVVSRLDVAKKFGLKDARVGFSITLRDKIIGESINLTFITGTNRFHKRIATESFSADSKNVDQNFIVKETLKAAPIEMTTSGIIKKSVSYIIPTRLKSSLTIPLLEKLRLGHSKDEIIVVAHNLSPSSISLLKSFAHNVIEIEGDFNWSEFNNLAADRAKNSYLIFMNDDMYPINDDWRAKIDNALTETKIVGARLIEQNLKIQHNGIGIFGNYTTNLDATHEAKCNAVTGAFMAISKTSFNKIGKFNKNLHLTGNDTEFCIRASKLNHLIEVGKDINFYHFESTTRHSKLEPKLTNLVSQWVLMGNEPSPVSEDQSSTLATENINYSHYVESMFKTIGVIKIDHIGDFFSCIEAFKLLRSYYPSSSIELFCSPEVSTVASQLEIFDIISPYRVFHKKSEVGLIEKLPQNKHNAYDLLIDFRKHGDVRDLIKSLKSTHKYAISQARSDEYQELINCGIRTFLGETDSNGQKNAIWQEQVAFVEYIKNTSKFLIRELDSINKELQLNPTPKEASSIRSILIFPFSGSRIREWPIELYIRLGRILKSTYRTIDVSFITSKDDAWQLQNTGFNFLREKINLVETSTINDAYQLITNETLVISNNSAPMWIASSKKAPFISIFSGQVEKAHWMPKGGIGISRKTTCSPCSLSDISQCQRELFCLNSISPYKVLDAVKNFLET